MIYLGASALVSPFMADRHTAAVRRFLRAGRPTLGVSDFASAEFASAVARRVRMAADAEPIEAEPADVRVASTFVRRFESGLRASDAPHVAVCHRLGLPLFTFDERQAAAARRLGAERSPAGPAEA